MARSRETEDTIKIDLQLDRDLLAAIEEWRRALPVRPSRVEVMRALIRRGLSVPMESG